MVIIANQATRARAIARVGRHLPQLENANPLTGRDYFKIISLPKPEI
jgi:hypothetical protein